MSADASGAVASADARATADAGAAEAGAADAAPHVVVVVLNWCREADTAECLRSLAGSRHPRQTVLLVDNGSPDGSGARLHEAFPEVPYVQTGENLGYTGGNNRGIAWALAHGADHVVVLNNDTVVDRDCVARLVAAAAADPRVGAVAPKILVHGDERTLWFAGGDLARLRATGTHRGEGCPDGTVPDVAAPVTFVTGCCFLVTRRALLDVGGFEESYFAYNEDVDLSARLLDAGYLLTYEPTARLAHKVPPFGAPPTPFQIVQRDRNRRRFAALRLPPLARAAFAAWFYPSRLALAARYAVRGDGERVRAILRGMVA